MIDLTSARANLKCAEYWIDRGDYNLEFYIGWRKWILDIILAEQLRTFNHEYLKAKD